MGFDRPPALSDIVPLAIGVLVAVVMAVFAAGFFLGGYWACR